MRHTLWSIVLSLSLLAFAVVPSSLAQEATPTNGLADLGLPTLAVTVTGTGYEGIPETLEAGRYLLTVTAGEGTEEFGGGVALVQPTGMSVDDYLALIMSGQQGEADGPAAATPMTGTEASPAAVDAGADAAEGMEGPPAELYEALFAGGTYALPGQTAEVVLDLPPGTWIAWADDPFAPQAPVVFEVTGEMPADLVEPESGATITMSEFAIEITAGELVSGPQVVKVENVGAQPHFIVDFIVPDGTTLEQIETVLAEEDAAMQSGTPVVYSDLNPEEDFGEGSLYTATQSTGTTLWVPVTLEPGTHGLVCFFPDVTDGIPHVNKGMFTLVVVE